MIKTISAALLITSLTLVAVPAVSDPMPMSRVFGCAVDLNVLYPPPAFPNKEYTVVFGGDADGQLCQDLINDLQKKGYSFSTITPGSEVTFSDESLMMSKPAPTIVHYMVRQRGN